MIEATRIGADDDVAVFEPSGDDALLACAMGARTVLAAAPDAATAALVELKRAAARELPAQSVRSFLGLGHFGRRVWFYHHLRPGLPAEARAWGDAHEGLVREGLLAQGAVERAMTELRTRVLPLAVGRTAVEALLAAPDLAAQREVVRRHWRGLRWRAAAALWLPRIARLAGADARDAAPHLHALLDRLPLAESPFAHALLAGAARDPDEAGTWRSSARFAASKPRLAGLGVVVGDRAALLAAAGPWSVVILGRPPLTPAEADALPRALRPGGRVLGWGPPPPTLRVDAEASAELMRRDRGVFGGRVWVGRRG